MEMQHMRIRTSTALMVVGAVVGIGGLGLIGYAAVVVAQDATAPHHSAFVDGPSDTFVSGVPAPGDGSVIDAPAAPIIVTPGQLAAGETVAMQPGQALLIVGDEHGGGVFVGEGGAGDDDVLRFEAASGLDDASFFALHPGTTTAWVAGVDGRTVTFRVTVVSS